MESTIRIDAADRAHQRLLEHYRGCTTCQAAGFYPSPGLWHRLTARRGPGYAYGDGSQAWCAEGLRLLDARTVARTFKDESGRPLRQLWNGLLSVWALLRRH